MLAQEIMCSTSNMSTPICMFMYHVHTYMRIMRVHLHVHIHTYIDILFDKYVWLMVM